MTTRRQFLRDVGSGMLVATMGPAMAAEFGFASLRASDSDNDRLQFGDLEPLVTLLQETSPDSLVETVLGRMRQGVDARSLIAAAALANARTFGGEDYVGFHTMMALAPAYGMSRALPPNRQALPILKVLLRNSRRIQEVGGASAEILRPIDSDPAAANAAGMSDSARLLDGVRKQDVNQAESAFANIAQQPPQDAFDELLAIVEENTEVHRVVLPYRAWVLLEFTGQAHAHTLLRQSVRYCVKNEATNPGEVRRLLPELLDRYRLLDKTPVGTAVDTAWIEQTAAGLLADSGPDGAERVAAALADGVSIEQVFEAISLTANRLVLHDPGRIERWANPQKPVGSVHGDSVGVHASDAVNAWRNIARVGNRRNRVAAAILAGYDVAQCKRHVQLRELPYPEGFDRRPIEVVDPRALLDQLDGAIRENDQAGACALVARYGELDYSPQPAFDVLLQYAVTQDGALHAEKYYQTASEEFRAARPDLRWGQLVALARVTASQYGFPAPGVEEATGYLRQVSFSG